MLVVQVPTAVTPYCVPSPTASQVQVGQVQVQVGFGLGRGPWSQQASLLLSWLTSASPRGHVFTPVPLLLLPPPLLVLVLPSPAPPVAGQLPVPAALLHAWPLLAQALFES